MTHQPVLAIGPEMPGWGSWDWVGLDLAEYLTSFYNVRIFKPWEIPPCDICLVIKHPAPLPLLEALAHHTRLLYCPIDFYADAQQIDDDWRHLRCYTRIVTHAERLRPYFQTYAPVEYLDHHLKYHAPLREQYRDSGEILWVGVHSNLPPLTDWLQRHPLPGPLRVLTNLATATLPSARELGFPPHVEVRLEEWTPARQRQRTHDCRVALDIKGVDFRSAHKPPAKAIDFLASGVPLAMNPESSSAEHLARLGFSLVSPLQTEVWLSYSYWQETAQLGRALGELLSMRRVGARWVYLLQEVLASRPRAL